MESRYKNSPREVENEKGLIAVAVPAGQGTLALSYHSPALQRGCWVSGTALLLLLFCWTPLGRRWLTSLANSSRLYHRLGPETANHRASPPHGK